MGKRKLTTEEFIEKAIKVHGDKYEYSKAVYVSAISKLIVTCRKHGDFDITPDGHANAGNGCRMCMKDTLRSLRQSEGMQFIVKAKAKHDGLYCYDAVAYVDAKSKVLIGCRVHGSFLQIPSNHLSGAGCAKCQHAGGFRQSLPGHLYVLNVDDTTKVGITNRKVALRVKELNRYSGKQFTIAYSQFFEEGATARAFETTLLNRLKVTHKRTEDIHNGSTECFVGVDLEDLLRSIEVLNIENKTTLTTS